MAENDWRSNPSFLGQVKGLLTEHLTGNKGTCPTCGAAMTATVATPGAGRRKVGINRGTSVLDDKDTLG